MKHSLKGGNFSHRIKILKVIPKSLKFIFIIGFKVSFPDLIFKNKKCKIESENKSLVQQNTILKKRILLKKFLIISYGDFTQGNSIFENVTGLRN